MLLHSHAAEPLSVQKDNLARGIIPPQWGASHALISTIFRRNFQYAPRRLSPTPLENVLTHLVPRLM